MNTYYFHSIMIDSRFANAADSRIDTGAIPA